jgi:type III secretion protein V
VRVRGNEGDMPLTSYVFMLDEIPLLYAELEPDRRFSPRPVSVLQAAGIPADELAEAVDPVTGERGSWAPLAHAERLSGAGIPLWPDPLAYMVRQLEALLQNHLSRYLGVQEVAALLDGWSQEARGAALVQSALPDETSRLHFVWLLRALLDEKVSIADWPAILQSVAATGLGGRDLSAALRAVRLALKEQLPGNQPGAVQLALPAGLEERLAPWLSRESGAPFLALPPEETQDALAEVRELLAPYEGSPNVALVVANGELRLPVRRLIALEFPQLMVLSGEEALPVAVAARAAQEAAEEVEDV